MIKYREFNGLNDNYDSESVILKRYSFIKNGDKSSLYDCLFNSFDVFQSICDLGKELFEEYLRLNNCTKNEIYKNRITWDAIFNFFDTDIGAKTEFVNNWISENGLPYSIKVDIKDQKLFIIEDSLTCYLYSQLHKRLILWKEEKDDYTDPNRKPSPKYNIELYVSLLRIDIGQQIKKLLRGSKYNKGVMDILLDDNNNEDEIYKKLDMLVYRNGNYSELIDDNIIFFIRTALISNIIDRFNDKYSIDSGEYILSKQIPVYNSTTKEYRFYETAVSLMGIAWNRLLQILSTTEYGYTRVPCRNEECNNYFVKVGKNQFCETCIDNGTARKIIYREYNKKRKKQTTSSPQTT